MMVSSDINSANHNYPTNYNEAIYVARLAPGHGAQRHLPGPGGLARRRIPDDSDAAGRVRGGLRRSFFGMLSGTSAIARRPSPAAHDSFFRNSNLTQYGGKADIVLMGAPAPRTPASRRARPGCSPPSAARSSATAIPDGQRDPPAPDDDRRGRAARQHRHDRPPDKAEAGWDPHFGYGRVNLAGGDEADPPTRRSRRRRRSTRPTGSPRSTSIASARAASPVQGPRRRAARMRAWAPGRSSTPAARTRPTRLRSRSPARAAPGASTASLGTPAAVAARGPRATNCDGRSRTTPGARPAAPPTAGPRDPIRTPTPSATPSRSASPSHEAGNAANFGRYRKTLFAYRTTATRRLAAADRPGSDADELRHRLRRRGLAAPLRRRRRQRARRDAGTSSGELLVLNADGTPVPSFNGGEPVRPTATRSSRTTRPRRAADAARVARVPAIGDIDGDLEPEIVVNAGEQSSPGS